MFSIQGQCMILFGRRVKDLDDSIQPVYIQHMNGNYTAMIFINKCVSLIQIYLDADLLEQHPGFEPKTTEFKTDRTTIQPLHHVTMLLRSIIIH